MNKQQKFTITVLRGETSIDLQKQVDQYLHQGWTMYYGRWSDRWSRPHQAMVTNRLIGENK